MPGEKVKVLIIDDSAIVRNMLEELLQEHTAIEVIGTAQDPYDAVRLIAKEVPDVITLDIEMPRMNGLTFLKKLMRQHPIPVVVVSSLTRERSDIAIKALELGASEIINKPRLSNEKEIEEYQVRLHNSVLAAAKSEKINYRFTKYIENNKLKPSSSNTSDYLPRKNKIIAIGASTGGTELFSSIFKHLKLNLPPIVVVQHMPGEFTKAFANRLNQESALTIKEAENDEILKPGHAYIANGYFHLVVNERSNHYVCALENGELVNGHRPSVDVLFRSLATNNARNVMGILLTGMGKDGAGGLLELKNKGAVCIVQDEKSSVVYGMPKEAMKLKAANFVGNPIQIINWINNFA